MKHIRKNLTYANVMSSLAVFLVLAGATAVAATHLAKNSVGTAQLKASAVTGAKLANGAVVGAKIRANSLDGDKIQDGSITSRDIGQGAVTGADLAPDALKNVVGAQAPDTPTEQGQFSFFLAKGDTQVLSRKEAFPVQATCKSGVSSNPNDLVADLVMTSPFSNTTVSVNEQPLPFSVILAANEEFELASATLLHEPPRGVDPSSPFRLQMRSSVQAVTGGGVAVTYENVAAGINLADHEGECFFSVTINELGVQDTNG
jgi:hypothetical protein